jgi:hypothetical protein
VMPIRTRASHVSSYYIYIDMMNHTCFIDILCYIIGHDADRLPAQPGRRGATERRRGWRRASPGILVVGYNMI